MANYCTNCGTPIKPECRFCTECGAEISQSSPPAGNASFKDDKQNIQIIDMAYLKNKIPMLKKNTKSTSRASLLFLCLSPVIFIFAIICLFTLPIFGVILLVLSVLDFIFFFNDWKKTKNEKKRLEASDYSELQVTIKKATIVDIKPQVKTVHNEIMDDEYYIVDVNYSDGTKLTYAEWLYNTAISNKMDFVGRECYLISIEGIMLIDALYFCTHYSLSQEMTQYCLP